MRWLMLCREPKLYSCKRIKQACEAKGISLDILDPNRMLLKLVTQAEKMAFQVYYQEGERYERNSQMLRLLPSYQAVLPRFGTTSTTMGCNVLRHFELQGIPTLNSVSAFLLARDKWHSLQALFAANLPIPMTSLAGELVSTSLMLAQETTPLVVKTLTGSQGIGVMLLENQNSAMGVIDSLKQAKISMLNQQFIAESKGQDIRAFVIGDKVVAAMQRSGTANEFRANIHLGATAQAMQLSEAEQQLAVKATKVIGLDIAGVDLIRSEKGLMVLEVNASPGLEGIEKATGIDLAAQIVEYLSFKL